MAKLLSDGMIAHISQEVTSLCACWMIKLINGTVLGFTDHDADIVYQDVTYKAETGFFRSALTNTGTLAPDEMTVNGLLDSASITEEDLRAGFYDYAEVWLFLVNWMNLSIGPVNLRYGHFGEVTMTPTGTYKIELRGLVQQLIQNVGTTVQPECNADLGDVKCGKVITPALRQALTTYRLGNRVLANVSTMEKIALLGVANADFGSYEATSIPGWVFDNCVSHDGGQQAGAYCVETVDWISTASSTVKLLDVFGVYTEDGAAVHASIDWRAASIYQQSRLYLSFQDSSHVEIGNAYLDYASLNAAYGAATLDAVLPVGAEYVVYKLQTRKMNTPTNGPSTPWDAVYSTFWDTASCMVTPIAGSPTQILTNPGFEISSTSTTRCAGWTPSTAVTLLSVTSWYQLTAENAGEYFLVMQIGWGLSGSQTSDAYQGPINLTGGADIADVDIDTGMFELVMNWSQANAGELGTAGIGMTFYDGIGAELQSIAPDMRQINPFYEWQRIHQPTPIPIGARSVKLRLSYGIPAGSVVTTYPRSVVTKIYGTVQRVGAGSNGLYSQYAGVEYQCTYSGVSGITAPSGWSTTIGDYVTDGTVTWQVVRPTWSFLGHATTVTSRSIFTVAGFTAPVDEFFQWGVCQFVSGQNEGLAREVVNQSGMNITLMTPPPFPVAVNDLVVLTVGCDKSMATCQNKFANILNFRGFPFVPGTDQYFKVGSPSG